MRAKGFGWTSSATGAGRVGSEAGVEAAAALDSALRAEFEARGFAERGDSFAARGVGLDGASGGAGTADEAETEVLEMKDGSGEGDGVGMGMRRLRLRRRAVGASRQMHVDDFWE